VNKYCNYVRTFIWQLCEWDRVDICMTFHKRAFDSITHVNSILPTQLPHTFPYIVASFIHHYFDSPNIKFRFRLQDRCSSKQSDWFDSQFHNQLSNDICACRQINWNRNKTTTTFVGQIAKQYKSKSKCNFILIYRIAFFQIFLQIFQVFFQMKKSIKQICSCYCQL
jgi:hypothetical protein